jgi:hypothetical protein
VGVEIEIAMDTLPSAELDAGFSFAVSPLLPSAIFIMISVGERECVCESV